MRRRGVGGDSCWGSRARDVRARVLDAAAARGPRRRGSLGGRPGTLLAARANAPGRPATTRSWPPGTDSRSLHWPRRRCCSTTGARRGCRRRRRRCWRTCTVPERTALVRAGVSRRRAGRHAAVLEDHGCVAEAFIAVLGITGDPVWLDRARVLLDGVLERFVAPDGGFFDTADDAEALVVRPRTPPTTRHPSGTSSAVAALVAFAAVTGSIGTARRPRPDSRRPPRSRGRRRGSPAGASPPPRRCWPGRPRSPWSARVRAGRPAPRRAPAHVARRRGRCRRRGHRPVPLFEGKTEVDGRPAAYVCRDFVCPLPVTDPAPSCVRSSESSGPAAGRRSRTGRRVEERRSDSPRSWMAEMS